MFQLQEPQDNSNSEIERFVWLAIQHKIKTYRVGIIHRETLVFNLSVAVNNLFVLTGNHFPRPNNS